MVDSVGENLMTSAWAFFGDPTSAITATTYPTGSGFDACHGGTVFFQIDSANIPSGTYIMSGMVKVSGPGVTALCAMVNLTDASETPIANFSETSETGAIAFSAPVAFAAGGTLKTYGFKTKVTSDSAQIWGIQLVKIA